MKGHDKVVKLIENALPADELLRQKEILKILAVAHSAHLAGISQLSTLSEIIASLPIKLEGGSPPYWLKRMKNATQAISDYYPDLLSPNETIDLLGLLDTGINASTKIVQERLDKGLPVLLNTGFKGHTVQILVWGNYFILCNRGAASNKNVEVFQFNPKDLNEEVLNKISQSQFEDDTFYKNLFFEELPDLLKFKKDKFEESIEDVCNLLHQTVGNCSWASPETGVWAFLVFRELLGNDSGQLMAPRPITEEESIKFKESKKFYTWLIFNQMYNLERYLGIRQVRSTEDPEKVKKSKGRQVTVIDYSLVSQAIKSIETILHHNIKDEILHSKIHRDLHEILAKRLSVKIEGADELMRKKYFDHVKQTIHSLLE